MTGCPNCAALAAELDRVREMAALDIDNRICACGCGGATRINSGRQARYVKGHNGRKYGLLWVVEDRGYDTACWVWARGYSGDYGTMVLPGRRTIGAHIWAWTLHEGAPVPTGLHIDHLCRVPACVNPHHLEPVTCAVNIQRGRLAKLTAVDVVEIRQLLERGVFQRIVAERYGVTQATISEIKHRRTWSNVA